MTTLTGEKCQLLDKCNAAYKGYADRVILGECQARQKSLKIASLIDMYRKAKKMKVMLLQKLTSMAQELKENSKCSRQEAMAEMLKSLESIKEFMTTTTAQGTFPNPVCGPYPSTCVSPVGLGLNSTLHFHPLRRSFTHSNLHLRITDVSASKGTSSMCWSSFTFMSVRQVPPWSIFPSVK